MVPLFRRPGSRRSVAVVEEGEETTATYVILRRCGWREPDELREALKRASAEGERLDVRWLRSFVLAEVDGSFGTVCVYDAPSPEIVRLHAYHAGLPVDEIVAVADVVVADEAALVGGSALRSPGETEGEGSRCI